MTSCYNCGIVESNELYCINKKFYFCSETCLNKMKYNQSCFCGNLGRDGFDFVMPGGYSGCGPSRGRLCCSRECYERLAATRCAACHGNDDLKEFNGKLYCNFNYVHPLNCYNIASGNYDCSFCDTTKNVSDSVCIVVRSMVESDRIGCYECVGSKIDACKLSKRYGNTCEWMETQYDDYTMIMRATKRFICGLCQIRKNIDELEIVDDENVCESCRQ